MNRPVLPAVSAASPRGGRARRLIRGVAPLALLAFSVAPPPCAVAQAAAAAPQAAAAVDDGKDVWQLMYLGDAKVGFTHSVEETEERGAEKLLRHTTDVSMTINRLGTNVTLLMSSWSVEDAAGQVREQHYETNMSEMKSIQHLVRDGDKATIETRIGGPTQKRTIDWNKEWLGEAAIDRRRAELITKGEKELHFTTYSLEAGETTIQMKVVGKEKVKVPGSGEAELLHVIVENSAAPVAMDIYLDEKLDERMTSTKMMGIPMITVRSTQATCVAAFAKPDTPEIFDKISPRTNVRLPNPYHTDEVVLHLRATDADTPMPKLEDERQVIVSKKDDRDVVLKVSRVVPAGSFTLPLANLTAEEKECLEPSPQVQCDDPELVKLAKTAIGDEKDAWKAAQKLERFVYTYISNKSMDKLFETAVQVMKTKAGDCTEHGVFLCGLCRAVGIPARVAVGLLYYQGIWGGHMWAEVSLGGKWYALDGVLGQGSVDAGHVRLAASSLKEQQIERAFQNVALGMTVKFDIVSFRHGEREVKVGEDFHPWTVAERRFTSTLYGFSLEAPEEFEIKPNDKISLHDLLVVEFAGAGRSVRVEATDVTYNFTLDQAKDVVAAGGLSRMKAEDRTLAGRPARLFRGKKGGGDCNVVAILDGQTLLTITFPKKEEGDDALLEELLKSLTFFQSPAAPGSGS